MSVEENSAEVAVAENNEEVVEEVEDEEALLGASSDLYNATEINDQAFEMLVLGQDVVVAVQEAWTTLVKNAESHEQVGEAIFTSVFETQPTLESMLKTPRAVLAMCLMQRLSEFTGALSDPKSLKVLVETFAFQYLEIAANKTHVGIFRDAIIDLLAAELGVRFTRKAREGWCTMLNYVGGALMYVRVNYASRIKIIISSWATANSKASELGDEVHKLDEALEGEGEGEGEEAQAGGGDKAEGKQGRKQGAEEADGAEGVVAANNNTSVPQTFNDMFLFNAAVMGFSNSLWMNEVLGSFDNIVTNVANSYRMQEECELLALTLDKMPGAMNLYEFKAVMLASLRSLVPKDWNSAHEVAWTWLWENVERLIKAQLGKPKLHEAAVSRYFADLDEGTRDMIRRQVFVSFFALAPAGMDVFKQSATRLMFIADKAIDFSGEIYREPKRMIKELSALGLRHVGYAVPTELFPPFVSAWIEVVKPLMDDEVCLEGFRWSLNLISRILMRVINEGSTIVMKAINANSPKMLKKAIACAPRGKRAQWMLNVQVGTQSISPFVWAIETGSLEAAKEIIIDLLTIRADRDRYYYGMDHMFERHPDIIKLLGTEAPGLLQPLLDGLIWRSRATENGQRRVNYYVKHLLVDSNGDFSKTIEWLTDMRDPKIVCHSCITMVTDTVWSQVAFKSFLLGKMWFILTLLVFILSQSVLKDWEVEERKEGEVSDALRIGIFVCRVFIYGLSLSQWLYHHLRLSMEDIRSKDFVRHGPIVIPAYLNSWQAVSSLALAVFLLVMLCCEPILYCLPNDDYPIFSTSCPAGLDVTKAYTFFSCLAMLCYYLQLVDLSVFSTRVSAFVLVCGRVMVEVAQFLFALCFFTLAFAAAVSCLEQYNQDFLGIPMSFLQLIKIAFGMFRGGNWTALHDWPLLMVSIFLYVVCTLVFLANVLIAQLNCLYQTTYADMVGYARLNRGKIVVGTMSGVSRKRWERFASSLRLDERVEFGEGDIGLPGGVQVLEPASANITTVDMIKRYGGSTEPSSQWPETQETGVADDEERFDRMEKMMEKAISRIQSAANKQQRRGGSSANESSDLTDQEASLSQSDQ